MWSILTTAPEKHRREITIVLGTEEGIAVAGLAASQASGRSEGRQPRNRVIQQPVAFRGVIKRSTEAEQVAGFKSPVAAPLTPLRLEHGAT